MPEDTTYEQAWERSRIQTRKFIPTRGKTRAVIAVEEVWNKFLLTAPDFCRYIDEFSSSIVQAYFDVENIIPRGVP